MTRIFQKDIARAVGATEMAISRTANTLGCAGRPLMPDDAILLLTVGALANCGLDFSFAARLARRFREEIIWIARDPEERRRWVCFVDNPHRPLTIAAVSGTHLANIIKAHPLTRVLALHEPASAAVEAFEALVSAKEDA